MGEGIRTVEVEFNVLVNGFCAKPEGRVIKVEASDNGVTAQALADLLRAEIGFVMGQYRMHLAGHKTEEFGDGAN